MFVGRGSPSIPYYVWESSYSIKGLDTETEPRLFVAERDLGGCVEISCRELSDDSWNFNEDMGNTHMHDGPDVWFIFRKLHIVAFLATSLDATLCVMSDVLATHHPVCPQCWTAYNGTLLFK